MLVYCVNVDLPELNRVIGPMSCVAVQKIVLESSLKNCLVM